MPTACGWTATPLGSGGLLLIRPPVFRDGRGAFMETWSERVFAALGIRARFVQDNESLSARRGTIRGIHFQRGKAAQAKLVRCVAGSILDVAADLRPESSEFLRVHSVRLSAAEDAMLFIPRGFGHGFVTLEDDVRVAYKADAFYEPSAEGSIRWDDPTLGVDWGLEAGMKPVLSPKDRAAPDLRTVLESGALGAALERFRS